VSLEEAQHIGREQLAPLARPPRRCLEDWREAELRLFERERRESGRGDAGARCHDFAAKVDVIEEPFVHAELLGEVKCRALLRAHERVVLGVAHGRVVLGVAHGRVVLVGEPVRARASKGPEKLGEGPR
jgi:hypothetical protein